MNAALQRKDEQVFDPEAMRGDFPALASGLAYFDAPGGSLVPRRVADAMGEAVTAASSSARLRGADGRCAADTVAEFRQAAADLLGGDAEGIVHGRSATALAFDLSRALAATWRPGDSIVLSELDHDSNITPWLLAAERAGARVRWARFDPATGELPSEQYASLVDETTRLVAVTAASNLIGTRPDIRAIADRAHAVDALLYVDGVHATAHDPVDLELLGADFYAFSPYKLFGPHFGLLAAAPALLERLLPDKLRPSPDEVPLRFELGMLPYELLAGCAAAVDYLAGLSPERGGTRRSRIIAAMEAVDAHEEALRRRLEEGLRALPGVVRHSLAARRTPTTLVSVTGRTPEQVVHDLLGRGVVAQAGNFYALRACERLGLGEAGGVRFGLAPYTTESEIDRLLEALADICPRAATAATAPFPPSPAPTRKSDAASA